MIVACSDERPSSNLVSKIITLHVSRDTYGLNIVNGRSISKK